MKFTSTAEWKRLAAQAKERDGHRCVACGRGKAEGVRLAVDHIVPMELGGPPLDLDNTQTLCHGPDSCHARKTKKDRADMAKAGVGPRGGVGGRGGTSKSKAAELEVEGVPLTEPARLPAPLARENATTSLTGSEGVGLPRFFSDPHPDRVDSRYPELASWGRATLGVTFYPWQAQVLDRLLEVDADGDWCWSGGFLISVPRQCGKSVLGRTLTGWLASQGQTVMGTTNRLRTAAELLRPLGLWAKDNGGALYRQFDQPAVDMPGGGRVVFQAATDSLAVGWSIDALYMDEVWDVKPEALSSAMPAMSAAPNPLLVMTSTVGNEESLLLQSQREVALAGGPIGIAEWSATPGADWLDEDEWRKASPVWHKRRLAFLRTQAKTLSESAFRQHYLNQHVATEHGWVPASLWDECAESRVSSDPSPAVAAVEITLDGSRHHVAFAARNEDGRIVIETHAFQAFTQVDAFLRERRPHRVLAPRIYENRLSRIDREVNTGDVARAMPVFIDLVRTKNLRHNGDPLLTESVLNAEAHVTKAGSQTIISRHGKNLAPLRAVLFAVGEASVVRAGRPRLRVAR